MFAETIKCVLSLCRNSGRDDEDVRSSGSVPKPGTSSRK